VGSNAAPRPLYLRKETHHPFHRRLGGSQGRYERAQKFSHPPGFDSRTIQTAASRYTDAIPPLPQPRCKDNVKNYRLKRKHEQPFPCSLQTHAKKIIQRCYHHKQLLPKRIRKAACQWLRIYTCQEFDKRRMDVENGVYRQTEKGDMVRVACEKHVSEVTCGPSDT
jgi:hypothetical protein